MKMGAAVRRVPRGGAGSLAARAPLALAAPCLVVAALSLQGCGGGSSGGSKARTTVIVMRHCVRSTENNGIVADPAYEYYDNYTRDTWPAFSVPPWHCVPRGADLVKAQGQWLRAHGGLPQPLHAVADNVPDGQRDNVTMNSLLQGLGMDVDAVMATVDHMPFAPAATAACKGVRPSMADMQRGMEGHLAANGPPREYHQYMRTLYEALGTGAAGDWTKMNCTATTSPNRDIPIPGGACDVAAEMTERLLMQWGGNMTLGPARLSAGDIPKLLTLHAWQFFNWFATPEVFKYLGASMTREVSAALDKAEAGTRLFVGHDSDIMMLQGALGLTWDAAPFPLNATLPGSMLRFDRDGDTVTASYLYVANFSASDGAMLSAPANFTASSSRVSLSELRGRAERGSLAACANPTRSGEGRVITV